MSAKFTPPRPKEARAAGAAFVKGLLARHRSGRPISFPEVPRSIREVDDKRGQKTQERGQKTQERGQKTRERGPEEKGRSRESSRSERPLLAWLAFTVLLLSTVVWAFPYGARLWASAGHRVPCRHQSAVVVEGHPLLAGVSLLRQHVEQTVVAVRTPLVEQHCPGLSEALEEVRIELGRCQGQVRQLLAHMARPAACDVKTFSRRLGPSYRGQVDETLGDLQRLVADATLAAAGSAQAVERTWQLMGRQLAWLEAEVEGMVQQLVVAMRGLLPGLTLRRTAGDKDGRAERHRQLTAVVQTVSGAQQVVHHAAMVYAEVAVALDSYSATFGQMRALLEEWRGAEDPDPRRFEALFLAGASDEAFELYYQRLSPSLWLSFLQAVGG